jgi:hypothetical protein
LDQVGGDVVTDAGVVIDAGCQRAVTVFLALREKPQRRKLWGDTKRYARHLGHPAPIMTIGQPRGEGLSHRLSTSI